MVSGRDKIPDVKYEAHDDFEKTLMQFLEIWDNVKNAIPILCDRYSTFSIMIAYDMYQKGIDSPEGLDDYYGYLLGENENQKRIMYERIAKDLSYIKSQDNPNITQMLFERVVNENIIEINMQRIRDDDIPYWDKVERMAEVLQKSGENVGLPYYTLYEELLSLSSSYFEPEHLYTQEEYNEFTSRMHTIFEKVGIPETALKTGRTEEMLFVKMISDNISHFSDNYIPQISMLITIIRDDKKRSFGNWRNEATYEYGNGTNMLENLGFHIYKAYEILKQAGNTELTNDFGIFILENVYRLSGAIRINNDFLSESPFLKQVEMEIVKNPNLVPFFEKQIVESLKNDKCFPGWFYPSFNNSVYLKEYCQEMPEDIKKSIGYYCMDNVKQAIFGTDNPSVEQFTPEILSQLPPIIQVLLKYDKYGKLFNRKDEAAQFLKECQIIFPPRGEKVSELDRKTSITGEDSYTSDKVQDGTISSNGVLRRNDIIVMAKRSDVQSCQLGANEIIEQMEMPERISGIIK